MNFKIALFPILLYNLLLFSNNILGQNMIRNGSFENASSSQIPDDRAQTDEIDFWEDDKNLVHSNPIIPTNSNICLYLHSPDYFNCSGSHYRLFDITYPVSIHFPVPSLICGKEGNCYVGMHDGEILEQKFMNSLEKNVEYRVKLSVRVIKDGTSEPLRNSDELIIQYFHNCTVSYIQNLKFYLATKKIKYGGDPLFCSGANNMENYTNFKDFTTNDITEIYNLPFNGSIFPYTSWNNVEFSFVVPNDHNYDWFGFEVQNSDSLLNSYILIDDISLYKKGCEPDNCSQTSGDIQATANEYHTKSNPWFIDNIGNVSKATIEIRTIFGQELKRTIEVTATNGIKNRIYWDGKDANNTELATASYLFKVKLENECESTDANMVVWVDNQSAGSFNYPTYSYDNSGNKIPKECCVADIYIDNVTLAGPDQKRFVASHSVNVATLPASWVTLTPDADVLFRAGSFVEVGPGFDPDNGTYNVEVVPCPGRYSNPEEEDNIIPSFNYTNLENAENENMEDIKFAEKAITIYPNPTNDKLFFNIGIEETYTAIIKDGIGKIILSQKINSNINAIDCSSLANGIYVILLSNEQKKLHFKFVKN
jgi:hypothetical protein